jgi:uncharacterized BrkB/YihY/UPF0761 family membrane protein
VEKMPSALELMEADYRALCEAWKDCQPKPRSWIRKVLLCLAVALVIAFPIFA